MPRRGSHFCLVCQKDFCGGTGAEHTLTRSDARVLSAIARGLTVKGIAEALHRTTLGVKVAVERVYDKLPNAGQLNSRVHAVNWWNAHPELHRYGI